MKRKKKKADLYDPSPQRKRSTVPVDVGENTTVISHYYTTTLHHYHYHYHGHTHYPDDYYEYC
jgi:cell division ATPase FtsA